MYQPVLPGEDVPNPRAWEWRVFTDTASTDSWGLVCHVGKDTLPAAKIEMSGDIISTVLLGPDYSVDGEETAIESRRGPFLELDEAKSAVEALLRLERSWPHQG